MKMVTKSEVESSRTDLVYKWAYTAFDIHNLFLYQS